MASRIQRHKNAIQLALLGVLLVLLHVWLIAPVIQNGDAAVYNEQIEQRVLAMRTTHIGYMLLGIVADTVLPFDVERNLNVMSLMFAAVGGASIVSISRKQGASWSVALMAAGLAFGLRPFLYGAVLAEVDVVACGLILFAVAAWVHARVVGAGIAFGLAMLVTPLAALSLPLFILGAPDGKGVSRRWVQYVKRLTIFALASAATYLPLVLYYWQDYWHGGRGILHAPRQPWSVVDQVMRSVEFFKAAAGLWMILALSGLVLALIARRLLAYGTVAAIILSAVVGERFLDVPVQLPHLCLLITFAISVVVSLRRQSITWLLLAAAWLWSAPRVYLDVAREVEGRRLARDAYLEMAKQTPKLIVTGLKSSWDDGLPFERIVYHKTKLGLGLDLAQFSQTATRLARTRKDYAIWALTPLPSAVMRPLARGWHRETRRVLGRDYEVWIPSSHSTH